jgi:hypothetical protein
MAVTENEELGEERQKGTGLKWLVFQIKRN